MVRKVSLRCNLNLNKAAYSLKKIKLHTGGVLGWIASRSIRAFSASQMRFLVILLVAIGARRWLLGALNTKVSYGNGSTMMILSLMVSFASVFESTMS